MSSRKTLRPGESWISGHSSRGWYTLSNVITCPTRKTTECYNEFPVLYFKNESYFLTSKNRIYIKFGTRRECSTILPTVFKIHGTWYRLVPNQGDSVPPLLLQLISKTHGITWTFKICQTVKHILPKI